MADLSDTGAERQLAGIALSMMEEDKCTLNYSYGYFACTAFEKMHIYITAKINLSFLKTAKALHNHGSEGDVSLKQLIMRLMEKKALLKYYCGGYNTLIDSALRD